jgi:hypothetical protein
VGVVVALSKKTIKGDRIDTAGSLGAKLDSLGRGEKEPIGKVITNRTTDADERIGEVAECALFREIGPEEGSETTPRVCRGVLEGQVGEECTGLIGR